MPETADRLAIRELFDAYAHCADRRDAKGQMVLFTEDTRFVVYMDAKATEPTQELHGRDSLAPVFDNLNTYVATTHFNGQSMVVLDGDRATVDDQLPGYAAIIAPWMLASMPSWPKMIVPAG
jgi:hypothetical protein